MTRRLFPFLVAVAVGACDNLGLGGAPEEIYVDIQASGASRVTLVTGTRWVSQRDPACEAQDQTCSETIRVLDADTAGVDVPYTRTYRFTDTHQYAVEVYPEGNAAVTIAMRIEIDGKEWFNEARDFQPVGEAGETESLQFIYQWQAPRIR
ncbi:MAG: hypothetical protein AMXMBFR53_22050 [Gemmatimonadota bacterium]